MRMFNIFSNLIHDRNKPEMLSYLRAMPVQQINALGFSDLLMEQGISAWPWREDNPECELDKVNKMIAEEKKNSSDLQALSDAELHDLGMSKGLINHAVRHGCAGIDDTAIDKAA